MNATSQTISSYTLAEIYINFFKEGISLTVKEVMSRENFEYDTSKYTTKQSFLASVSKQLKKLGFNKKAALLQEVVNAYHKCGFELNDGISIEEKVNKIKNSLPRKIKNRTLQDYLQGLGFSKSRGDTELRLESFKSYISENYSFEYAMRKIDPDDNNRYLREKCKNIFIKLGGDVRETYRSRRINNKHQYLNIKDELNGNKQTKLVKELWCVIGLIFADGSGSNPSSIQIVLTESDGSHLEIITSVLLKKGLVRNLGPRLIKQTQEKCYPNSKPILRLHVESSFIASYLNELGLPGNKEKEDICLSDKILNLDSPQFFSFLSGLFDGDGCITHSTNYLKPIQVRQNIRIYFDLNQITICEQLKDVIYKHTGLNLTVELTYTKAGEKHYRLCANTSPVAFTLLAYMYFYSPFQLKRKIEKSDVEFKNLALRNFKYQSINILPSMYTRNEISIEDFETSVAQIKSLIITKAKTIAALHGMIR
tara:strand:+ start:182147 stop:183589 length:1443 start_codon:yes stop_codon:yes gene_type:complete